MKNNMEAITKLEKRLAYVIQRRQEATAEIKAARQSRGVDLLLSLPIDLLNDKICKLETELSSLNEAFAIYDTLKKELLAQAERKVGNAR